MKPRNSKLVALLVLLAIVAFPAIASAQEAGSDTSAFGRYASENIFLALGASFVFGIVASLTPCVYPMVPITVSIFGATESKSRLRSLALSATFVLGIATLFTTLGTVSALTGSMMGGALAKPAVKIGMAVLFFALASSMFGAFELALPSSLNNKLSTVGGVGYKGAYILGLVLGLVAAPCTGPFLTGMLVWIGETKSIAVGVPSMFSFSLGLGMIFFLAGAFALNLPKAGAWMMGIKWGSGVLLAYMGLSYLRDGFPAMKGLVLPSLAYGVIGGAALAIGIGMGIVHVAAERRRSKIAHLSKPMKLASILPAIAGAFMFVSWIQAPKADTDVIPSAMAADPQAGNGPIVWHADEAAARAKATADKKPIMVDFGAEWCGACKELEHKTFPDARVRQEGSRFVAIRVDGTDDEDAKFLELKTKYKVIGLPTLVLIDSSGKEAARFTEFVEPERLAEAMKKVK